MEKHSTEHDETQARVAKLKQEIVSRKRKGKVHSRSSWGSRFMMLLFLAAIIGVGYLYLKDRKVSIAVEDTTLPGNSDISTSDQPENRKSTQVTVKVERSLVVSAQDLISGFRDNAVRAEQDYSGKRITIHGKIRSIEAGDAGTYEIDLTGNNSLDISGGVSKKDIENFFYSIRCKFDRNSLEGILNLTKDSYTTISGVCGSMSFYSIDVSDCRLE